MREVLPTELLLRLMNATPEQYAAVERVLGMGSGGSGLGDRTKGTEGTNTTPARGDGGNADCGLRRGKSSTPHPHSLSPIEAERGASRAGDFEDVARSAFALLQRLDADKHGRKPTLLTVFRLYCVDGLSAEQVAVKCRCAKATVLNRLRIIEERTGTKADGFRAVSGHLARLEDEFNDSRARGIYRQGMANAEEEEI